MGVRPVLRKTAPLADARGSASALKSIPTFRAATVRKRYTVFGMTDFRWNPQNG